MTKPFQFVILLLAASASLICTGCRTSQPPLVIGLYGVTETNLFPEIRSAGFNLITGPAEKGWLDAAKKSNLKVFTQMGTTAGLDFDLAKAGPAVKSFDDHPAVWAWYLVDEPDLHAIHPELVYQARRWLRSIGARKPVGVVLQNGREAINFTRGADLLLIDRYPVAWQPLAVFEQHVRMARLGAGENKPLIAIIQAFDWTYHKELIPGEQPFRAPTEQEMRCMSYGALAQGANGLFYYALKSPPWDIREHPETWQGLKNVAAEVRRFGPLFQASHLWWQWKNSIIYEEPQRLNEVQESRVSLAFLQVTHGDSAVPAGEYVLAVNTTAQPANVRIFLPRICSESIPVLGSNSPRPLKENWVSESIEPYGVRVFGPLQSPNKPPKP